MAHLKPAIFSVVTNTSDSGAGSLRQALTDSNATANIGTSPNQIQFAIGSGAQLIALASSLPALTQPVIVDGWSQPGFNGAPLIEINGNGAGEVFRVSGGGSIIRGFVLNNYVGSGINLTSDGNIVIGNYAGTNAAGTTSGPGLGTYGIAVGSSNNQIGGLSAQDRNVIGHNYFAGIIVDAVGPISNNRIVNNHIGVNAAGTAAIPNGGGQAYAGVILGLSNAGVSGTVIGGNDPSLRNVIAGNNGDGIGLWFGSTSGTVIKGNFIGVGADGVTPLGNNSEGNTAGVNIRNSASNNTIGGIDPGEGNVIAYNDPAGVRFSQARATACAATSSTTTVSVNLTLAQRY